MHPVRPMAAAAAAATQGRARSAALALAAAFSLPPPPSAAHLRFRLCVRSGRRSPFEQFQAADEKGSPEDAAQQRGAQDAAVAALLEEGGPENGADGPAGGGDEVHDGQAEAALLRRGDVGDEGIEAHLKGQVAAGDGHYIERSKLLPF